MFKVTSTQQGQYLTYFLQDQESQVNLEVVPQKGGIVTSWKIKEQEIFYLDTERFKDPELSVRGGIPILFPICGNLADNTYTHQGKSYQLKQHGFARDLPWTVLKESTVNSASLTLSLESTPATRQVYPFDFKIEYTYEIVGQTLRILQKYTNKSNQVMPYSHGFHPYFQVADKSQLAFVIPSMCYEDKKTQTEYRFAGDFDFSLEEIDVTFGSLSDSSVTYRDTQRGLELQMSYSPDYSKLVFWTVKGKDFICLEPWTSPRNAFNTGTNLLYLEAGQSQEAVVEMNARFF